MLSIVEKDLKGLIFTPEVFMINITVGKNSYNAIIKETQFHPVSDKVLHIDFLQVAEDKKIVVSLPVNLVGAAEGAKQGGKLALTTRKLRVFGFPKDLPEQIDVNITDLGLGKSRLVNELSFDKFVIIEPKSTVIATVKLTRAARGAAAADQK